MYGRLEEANACIDSLLLDKDPLLRRAGAFTIATAYCGTASNSAVRQLLHMGVSDVDDNVRRSAITCIGFVLFRSPEQCPSMVALLLESYNPHMRAGALMAMGVACSGTGNKVGGRGHDCTDNRCHVSVCVSVCPYTQEALGLIEPLLADPTNFVRQSALVASSLILIQQTEAMNPKVGGNLKVPCPHHMSAMPTPHLPRPLHMSATPIRCVAWCRWPPSETSTSRWPPTSMSQSSLSLVPSWHRESSMQVLDSSPSNHLRLVHSLLPHPSPLQVVGT